jgi:hypothetical protein
MFSVTTTRRDCTKQTTVVINGVKAFKKSRFSAAAAKYFDRKAITHRLMRLAADLPNCGNSTISYSCPPSVV